MFYNDFCYTYYLRLKFLGLTYTIFIIATLLNLCKICMYVNLFKNHIYLTNWNSFYQQEYLKVAIIIKTL